MKSKLSRYFLEFSSWRKNYADSGSRTTKGDPFLRKLSSGKTVRVKGRRRRAVRKMLLDQAAKKKAEKYADDQTKGGILYDAISQHKLTNVSSVSPSRVKASVPETANRQIALFKEKDTRQEVFDDESYDPTSFYGKTYRLSTTVFSPNKKTGTYPGFSKSKKRIRTIKDNLSREKREIESSVSSSSYQDTYGNSTSDFYEDKVSGKTFGFIGKSVMPVEVVYSPEYSPEQRDRLSKIDRLKSVLEKKLRRRDPY